jgi:hypothetical protein
VLAAMDSSRGLVRLPRIGDPDWDELFWPNDRRFVKSATSALDNLADGRMSASDTKTLHRILDQLQRRRHSCDSYDDITSCDRTLDL